MGHATSGIRTIDIRDHAAVAVLADPEAGGVFEVIRRFGRPVAAARVADAAGLGLGRVMERIDALVSIGLVRAIRPRAPRKVFAYKATCGRIVVTYDSRSPEQSRAVLQLQSQATRDAEEAMHVQPASALDGTTGRAWHQTRMKCRLRPEHMRGLGQRLHAIGEYLMQVALEDPMDGPDASPLCNFVVGINLVPLDVPLLPSPPIVAVPQSASSASIALDASTGFAGMTHRERQVAVALRDGRTRNEIAHELGISPNTVGTITRKVYAKLGVHRRAELVTRLAGLVAG
jgi:DNA-binding CsgD family transcriptional regulator